MTITQLFDLADPRIRGIWDEKTTQLSTRMEYMNVWGFKDMDAPILNPEFENFTGLGLAQLTGEKQPYYREDIAQAFKVTITPQKFTLSDDITDVMLRFNLWPKINNLVAAIANGLYGRVDTNAAKIFYLGFGTTFFTGGDGQPLYSASHPMLDGSVQSNTLGTLPLSYTNLQTAVQNLDLMYDDKGIRLLPARRLRLIVPRRLKERALEVLRSIGNPDNANRVSNVFANGEGSIELKVSNWIPDSTSFQFNWWVVDLDRAEAMAKMVWGWKPMFDNDKVIVNGTKVYTGSTMFQPGFQSFQWTVASQATSV